MFSLVFNCGILDTYLDHITINSSIHLQPHMFKINQFFKVNTHLKSFTVTPQKLWNCVHVAKVGNQHWISITIPI